MALTATSCTESRLSCIFVSHGCRTDWCHMAALSRIDTGQLSHRLCHTNAVTWLFVEIRSKTAAAILIALLWRISCNFGVICQFFEWTVLQNWRLAHLGHGCENSFLELLRPYTLGAKNQIPWGAAPSSTNSIVCWFVAFVCLLALWGELPWVSWMILLRFRARVVTLRLWVGRKFKTLLPRPAAVHG